MDVFPLSYRMTTAAHADEFHVGVDPSYPTCFAVLDRDGAIVDGPHTTESDALGVMTWLADKIREDAARRDATTARACVKARRITDEELLAEVRRRGLIP